MVLPHEGMKSVGGQTLISGEERTSDIDRQNIVAEDKG